MFSRSRDDRDSKTATAAELAKNNGATRPPTSDAVSKLGQGMLITGNIVCDGALQIYGFVVGDIHAAHLSICQGANVEGKIVANECLIDGTFKGTIQANSVKLHGNAMVQGEVFNKSLHIEANAQFEGVARRLDKTVEPPSTADFTGERAAPATTASGNGLSGGFNA